VSSLDARFAAPVTPGEVITVRASGDRRSARFDALVGDNAVVKDGHLTF
jgi:acyl dehydratase